MFLDNLFYQKVLGQRPLLAFVVVVVVVDPGFVGQSVVVVHKDYLSQSAFFLIKMFLSNLFDHDYLGHFKKI